MNGVTKLIPENLKFARQLKGFSKTDLSEEMGVSRQAISNWENGNRSPDFSSIKKISDTLGTPYRFFTTKYNYQNHDEEAMTLFRSKVAVPKKTKLSFERAIEIYGRFIHDLAKVVVLPEFSLENLLPNNTEFDILDYSLIESKANKVRKFFQLENGPIANVTALLERAGIYVVFVNEPGSGVNALTKKINNRYLVLLNIANQSSVRIRFSLAHELGHILLHSKYSRKIQRNREIQKRLEYEANLFASCLLLPIDGFILDVVRPTLGGLMGLKPHWKVAIQAMAVRLRQLGIISDDQEVLIFKEISRKYSRKAEPYDFGENSIEIELPTLINSALYFLDSNKVQYESYLQDDGLDSYFLKNLFPYLDFAIEDVKIQKPHLHLL